jgi:P pilus assembly chaperone PapD
MTKITTIFLIGTGVLAAIAAGIVIWPVMPILFSDDRITVILQNETNRLVTSASVSFDGKNNPSHSIAGHASSRVSFKVNAEGSYHVHVEFEGGRPLDGDFGYLTKGIGQTEENVVVIYDDHLEIKP